MGLLRYILVIFSELLKTREQRGRFLVPFYSRNLGAIQKQHRGRGEVGYPKLVTKSDRGKGLLVNSEHQKNYLVFGQRGNN